MESDRNKQLVHLRLLAQELRTRGLLTELLDNISQASVKVANPDSPELTQRILCKPAGDGSWCFWWPWQQPIGSADDLADVALKITTVLRPVEGTS
jgi:hypothetical protein